MCSFAEQVSFQESKDEKAEKATEIPSRWIIHASFPETKEQWFNETSDQTLGIILRAYDSRRLREIQRTSPRVWHPGISRPRGISCSSDQTVERSANAFEILFRCNSGEASCNDGVSFSRQIHNKFARSNPVSQGEKMAGCFSIYGK